MHLEFGWLPSPLLVSFVGFRGFPFNAQRFLTFGGSGGSGPQALRWSWNLGTKR